MIESQILKPPAGGAGPPSIVNLAELLEDVPLQSPRAVQKLFEPGEIGILQFPEAIRVHCDHHDCEGLHRHVRHRSQKFWPFENRSYHWVSYSCVNCTVSLKVFGLKAERKGPPTVPGICTKIYQEPVFGHPIPKRLFQVIGEGNREHFLQARRAIARRLGIGSYRY